MQIKRILFISGILFVLLVGGILMRAIPPLATTVNEIFWGMLGESDSNIFARAAEIVKQLMFHDESSTESIASGFLLLLSSEIISAILMGSCIFILKSIFTKFDRNYGGSLLYPKWLITFLGVCLGVGVNSLIGAVAPEVVGALLKSILSLGLILLGIGMMLGFKGRLINPAKKSHRRFRRSHLGYITTLVLGVLGNAFNAILAVCFVSGYMTGPAQIHAGGNGLHLLELCVCCLVLMWVFDIVLVLIEDLSKA